jgi:HSP20 family protein
MNSLSIWHPMRELEELQGKLWSFFRHTPIDNGKDADAKPALGQWAPLVDITEDSKEFLIKVELPEMKKEDVKISVSQRVLTIQGERHQEKTEEGKRHHRIERSYGAFLRSFTLPDTANENDISADYLNGVLSIHLPKCPEPAPKSIEVAVK